MKVIDILVRTNCFGSSFTSDDGDVILSTVNTVNILLRYHVVTVSRRKAHPVCPLTIKN